mmetsp:Transcript_82970/g.247519  ORF Transcript_82970/g.247519 Transcript_82970/m.247519 type:complete len:217 (-) Transcript_82970:133-783(-)
MSCNTKAEVERARAPPRTTRAPAGSPGTKRCAQPAMSRPVTTYWAKPSPKTSYFMERTFSMESSRPISKRKNTMPNSARMCASCSLWMRSKPEGPSRTPMIRKAMMGDVPIFLTSGTSSAVAKSKPMTSRAGEGEIKWSRWCSSVTMKSPTMQRAFQATARRESRTASRKTTTASRATALRKERLTSRLATARTLAKKPPTIPTTRLRGPVFLRGY